MKDTKIMKRRSLLAGFRGAHKRLAARS